MTEKAFAPRDVAGLVAFRIAFGLLVAISATRFLVYGWIGALFVRPEFRFTYWGFEWVPALSASGIHALFVALGLLGLAVAAGLFYRVATVALFVVFTWIQLIDVSNYLNHYYLVSLLALLLAVMPLNAAFSLDVWRKPSLRRTSFPAWCTWLLRFQVATVYMFAGLAKLNSDWLLHAQPLSIWLNARTGLPGIGGLFDARVVAFAAAWGGFLFDSTVPLFLMWKRTRAIAFVVVVGFHLATWVLFPIGMFPAIMITSALVFFSPSWPRKFLRQATPVSLPSSTPPRWAAAAIAVALLWCSVQLALPLRTHLYGGDVSWHEQGMRFSWRVMTREKNGAVTFIVRSPTTGREWHVSPNRYLTRLQEREMAVQPDLILQLAHHIGDEWRRKGEGEVEVRADARVSLNGRPAQTFVDPAIDLMRERDGLGPKAWILAGPTSLPVQLERRAAR
jgi:vitamin K-dependent gamma-carboxylase